MSSLICCDAQIGTKKKFYDHLKTHFKGDYLLDAEDKYLCFMIGCASTCTRKKSVIRHLKNAHPLVHEQIFRRSNSDSSESDEAAVDDQVHSPGLGSV